MTQVSQLPIPALLEICHVVKYYDRAAKPALDDVSFSVRKGEFVAVIGPSGAGKSTLLRCVNRMTEVSTGEVRFEGTCVGGLKRKDLRRLRSTIGMIFQHYNLVDRLTVIENVLHGRLGSKSTLAGAMGRYSRDEKQQAMDVITMLGLGDHVYRRCDHLSGGQKQRVGIGRALIQDPKLILCDEPIASLDPNSSTIIMDHLKRFCRTMHITLIVNLHQVDVAIKYSDRILGINGGRLVFDGKPDELSPERLSQIYGTEITTQREFYRPHRTPEGELCQLTSSSSVATTVYSSSQRWARSL
ncbi:MAG TPA: phosphonate ABC transporter ATP-binding protein [Xanthobacteraceae bacterium]|nr:phosphonate ABC transporter ATP-binding protein [Xanthobacteraceae bacterium]